jgi:hypothetical protein
VNKPILLGPQIEMHTAELLVHESSAVGVQFAVANMKKYKSPGSDQILAEIIEAGGGTSQSKIHKLSNSIWNEEQLLELWKEFYRTNLQEGR